jgi:hypothetical protein
MNARRRDLRSFVRASAIAAIAIGETGCSGAGGPDACALIAGETFASVNQMECGLDANGAATFCTWRVSFQTSWLTWDGATYVVE